MKTWLVKIRKKDNEVVLMEECEGLGYVCDESDVNYEITDDTDHNSRKTHCWQIILKALDWKKAGELALQILKNEKK